MKKTNDTNSKKKSKDKNKNPINRKVKRKTDLNTNTRDLENNMKTQIKPEIKHIKNLIFITSGTTLSLGKFICIFTSIENILYLLYSETTSIICYNLIDKKIMTSIKNAHPDDIRTFSHYLNKKDRKDLLISISEQNLKVWNFNNFENILSIEMPNESGKFYSGCFINENDNINILTINKNYSENGTLDFSNSFNVLNLNGNIIKNIKQVDDITYIDCYYNKKTSKNYIILGHSNKIRTYDYKNNNIYNTYNKSEITYKGNMDHMNIIINDNEELIKIIAPNNKFIEIWNFDTGILINKINIKENVCTIGLWNDKFLFAGCAGKFKLIDYKEGIIKQIYKGEYYYLFPNIIYLEKLKIPLYGECLLYVEGFNVKLLYR